MNALQLRCLSVLLFAVTLLALPAAATTAFGQSIRCVENSETMRAGTLVSCIPDRVELVRTGDKNVTVSCEKGFLITLFDNGTLESCLLTGDRTFHTGDRKAVNCNRASPVTLFRNGDLKSCAPTRDEDVRGGSGPSRRCGQFRPVSFFENGDLEACTLRRDETISTGGKTDTCRAGQSVTLSEKGQMRSCR